MSNCKDIVISIFEEYIKLMVKNDDEKSLGRRKGKLKGKRKKS